MINKKKWGKLAEKQVGHGGYTAVQRLNYE